MKIFNVMEIKTVVLLLTLERICASTKETCIAKKLKILFLSLPKLKAITVGVFYRTPNQADAMDLMVKKVSN